MKNNKEKYEKSKQKKYQDGYSSKKSITKKDRINTHVLKYTYDHYNEDE